MTHFILDGTTIPGPKIEWDEDPAKTALTNPEMFCRSSDYNKIRQALLDTQNWVQTSIVNVKSVGAVGDGVADDSAAITSAIASVAATVSVGYGGLVVFPKGTYLSGSQISLPNGVGLLSEVPTAAIIKASNTFNATSLITNSTHDGTQEFAFLDGIKIDGNQAGGAVCSVAVVDWVSLFINSYIRNCIITNGSNVGLRIAATGSPGGMGPLFIQNTWVSNCLGDNVVGEETGGNAGACAGIYFDHLTSENQGTNKAAVRFTGLGHCTQWHLKNTHIEMGTAATGRVGIKLDGVSRVLIDGVQLLTSAGTVAAGIQITNVAQNVGIQIREVTNDNLINPVLSDLKNSVTIGAVNIDNYVTPDVTFRGAPRFLPDTATGAKSLVAQSSTGVDRAWFDDLGQLTGSSLNAGGVDIKGDAANNRPLILVPSAASGFTNVYGYNFPVGGGGVIQFRSITGNKDVFQVGTDGTLFIYQPLTIQLLMALQSGMKGPGARAAAPSTGTHVAGEIYWNADPIAGGFMGWMCMTGGTPGTWQSCGLISPIAAATVLAGAGEFGTGVDGAAVFDGAGAVTGFTRSGSVYTATCDAFFTTVTLSNGVTVDMTGGAANAGWDIFGNALWTVVSGTATIKYNGIAAVSNTAGAGLSANPRGSSSAAGTSGIQNAGGAGANTAAGSRRFKPGVAGAGGASGTVAGGAGGTITTTYTDATGAAETWAQLRFSRLLMNTPGIIHGGAGGGAGGGTLGVAAGGGGGGGGGCGVVGIRQLAATGTLVISADGGVGGDGVAGGGSNTGGGGGGGGGTLAVGYGGSSTPGNLTIQANGGAGGAKQGTGTAGSSGGAGTARLFPLGPS